MTARSRASAVPIAVLVSCSLLSLGSSLAYGGPLAGSATPDPDSLCRRALDRLESASLERGRLAARELELALELAPDCVDLLHVAARAYSTMGYMGRARACLDRIAVGTSDDADVQIQLGLLWKSEWLASLEITSYQKAVRCLARGAQLAPGRVEPRAMIVALALAKGDTSLAYRAAESAVFCDRSAVQTALALGCAAYRTGRLAVADSVIRAVRPRLTDGLRARFDDLAAVVRDGAPGRAASGTAAAESSFPAEIDPDLTTPENEVQLDHWSRVAHAALLFEDPNGLRWDARAELLTRYGVPPKIVLPPPPGIDEDVFTQLTYIFTRREEVRWAPPPLPYPYHKQTWVYPELGIRAELWDRGLQQSFAFPVTEQRASDLRADASLLADRPDLVMLGRGRGVYRSLAPGLTPMPARGAIAHFPSDRGARLVAHLEASSESSERLRGSWVVVDTGGHEVARGSGTLSLSACLPGERRIVQFEAEVPPGDYRVHMSVDNERRQRGVVRLGTRVESAPPGLTISDLVLLCGASVGVGEGGPVLLEPAFERPLKGARTVSVYFEADHLEVDAQGRSRFSYRYTLHAVNGDERSGRPVLEAEREEENVGPYRRQVVSAPIASLRRGTYDFEIEVRDLVSSRVATRAVRFVKE